MVISVQHYPQNNCFGGHDYQVDYYMNHSEGALIISSTISATTLYS